jgi:hydrogenase expression/formation protein HypE
VPDLPWLPNNHYIIVNGFIGDHGATIMQSRAELAISADIASDCQVLNHLVEKMLSVS